jgi:hypothetical protein
MQEFPMPSYDSFMCPNCEHYFRVVWPDPMPSHHDPCSKIKMKCPDCGEVTELYDYLITKILQAPEPGDEILSRLGDLEQFAHVHLQGTGVLHDIFNPLAAPDPR